MDLTALDSYRYYLFLLFVFAFCVCECNHSAKSHSLLGAMAAEGFRAWHVPPIGLQPLLLGDSSGVVFPRS